MTKEQLKKIRKQFLLDPHMEKRLEEESDKTGASQAEIVRRALEEYLNGKP